MLGSPERALDKRLLFNRSTGLIESSSSVERIRARTLNMFHRIFASINYLGISRVFAVINKAFKPQGITVISDDQFSFEYPSGDYYWDRLLDKDWRYEPEIEHFLRRVGNLQFIFFDLGANFGFWSTRIAQHEFGKHSVVAVEASSESISVLRENLSRAAGPSKTIHRIVDSASNAYKSIYGKRHAGMSIVVGWDGENTPVETLETVSVDDLFEEMGVFANRSQAVCKIDIEGAELNALQGAHRAADTDSVFILEETGDLDSSETLSYASDVLGLQLFVLSETGAVPVEYWSSRQTNRKVLFSLQKVGVNIVATKSQYWLSQIRDSHK